MLGVFWGHYLCLTYEESFNLLYSIGIFTDRKVYDKTLKKISKGKEKEYDNLFYLKYNEYLITFFPNYKYLWGTEFFNKKDSKCIFQYIQNSEA